MIYRVNGSAESLAILLRFLEALFTGHNESCARDNRKQLKYIFRVLLSSRVKQFDCSAPEVWQRTIHEFVEDLEGVEVITEAVLTKK